MTRENENLGCIVFHLWISFNICLLFFVRILFCSQQIVRKVLFAFLIAWIIGNCFLSCAAKFISYKLILLTSMWKCELFFVCFFFKSFKTIDGKYINFYLLLELCFNVLSFIIIFSCKDKVVSLNDHIWHYYCQDWCLWRLDTQTAWIQ